jgi:hypothetical protein
MESNPTSQTNPNNLEVSSQEADPAYKRARRRVRELKGFYSHLAIYCIVITALFLINVATGRGWWFFWPAIGWGIGIAVHALSVYGLDSMLGADWEERKIRELMNKDSQRRQ